MVEYTNKRVNSKLSVLFYLGVFYIPAAMSFLHAAQNVFIKIHGDHTAQSERGALNMLNRGKLLVRT